MAKDTQTYLQSLSFEELVTIATHDVHSNLLEGGAKGMKSAIHKWMAVTLNWQEDQKRKKK